MKKIFILIIVFLAFSIKSKSDFVVFGGLIETVEISQNYGESVVSGGIIDLVDNDTDVAQYGICWNTAGNPTTSDTKTVNDGPVRDLTFSNTMTPLTKNTIYSVRAYIINDNSETYYGEEIRFMSAPLMDDMALIGLGILTLLIGTWQIKRIFM